MKRLFIALLFLLAFISVDAQALMIFGGEDHDVFLGCLNAGKYDSNSIWNKYGDYGSKYSSCSIWNKYGNYGGKYSSCSPFNTYASDPPVIVDEDGNFYGYFTANKYKSDRCKMDLVEDIIKFHEYIVEDVGDWYDKLFD